MKRYLFLALVFTLAGAGTPAQTTVADFDSPACSRKGIGLYQGIDFSLSPWDCENPGLTGQTGTSISWYRRTFSGQFKLQTPGTLLSLNAATTAGSGTLTISTDAGGASVNINLTQSDPLTFQVVLIGTNNTALGAPAIFQVSKVMFPATLTGINAKIVLSKSTATIKSFDMSLAP